MSYTYSDAFKNIPAVSTIPMASPLPTRARQPEVTQEAAVESPDAGALLTGPTSEPITLPYFFQVKDTTVQLREPVVVFSALLLPLSGVNNEIATLELGIYNIIILTGGLEPMLAAIHELDMNAVLFEGGYAILTDLPIVTITNQSLFLEPATGKTLQIVAANLADPSPLVSFQNDPEYRQSWQTAVQESHIFRKQAMSTLLDSLEEGPILLAASLFEPSGLDWTEFSQVPYRVPYNWPMSDFLAERGYIDSYRATHFSEETDEGTTWSATINGMELSERIDFLYAKDIIPMETKLVEVFEPGSIPKQSGVVGYFLIP
jgi:hypothetical protein